MGLRELKKAKTRKTISDIATQLFLDRGYHEVTTAEIAERAEVSVPTLFKYFPTKESLVFDEDFETEERLLNAVIERREDQGIVEALLEHGLTELEAIRGDVKKQFVEFMALIDGTPELSAYAKQMWMRHEQSLAVVLRKESKNKLGTLESEAIARFVLDSFHRALGTSQPKASLKRLFKIMSEGWAE